MEARYTVKFFLNDGEFTEIVARSVTFPEIFTEIFKNIAFHYPDWKWGEGNNNCIQTYFYSDGKTYIRLNGIGDVWKGDTYYIIEEDTE